MEEGKSEGDGIEGWAKEWRLGGGMVVEGRNGEGMVRNGWKDGWVRKEMEEREGRTMTQKSYYLNLVWQQ